MRCLWCVTVNCPPESTKRKCTVTSRSCREFGMWHAVTRRECHQPACHLTTPRERAYTYPTIIPLQLLPLSWCGHVTCWLCSTQLMICALEKNLAQLFGIFQGESLHLAVHGRLDHCCWPVRLDNIVLALVLREWGIYIHSFSSVTWAVCQCCWWC